MRRSPETRRGAPDPQGRPNSTPDGALLAARVPLAQDALTQVIAASTSGDAWVTFTTAPAAVIAAVRRGALPPGCQLPVLITVAPLDVAGATDDEVAGVGAWIGRGWIAARDLRQAGLRLLDIKVTVQVAHANGGVRAARRRQERGS